MAGAPGYVHISQRARTAAASQMAAAAGGAAPRRRRPGMRRLGAVEAGGAPQQVRADRRLNPQDPGVSSEARGFVLYVGLGEAKAAANGTTLVEIVQQLRRSVAQIAPSSATARPTGEPWGRTPRLRPQPGVSTTGVAAGPAPYGRMPAPYTGNRGCTSGSGTPRSSTAKLAMRPPTERCPCQLIRSRPRSSGNIAPS